MKPIKICFVGVGSIARRHINNLRIIGSQRKIDFQIDAYRRRPDAVEGVDYIYTDFTDIPGDYDIVFITNPTDKHMDALKKFHYKGKHFFIEKPVVSLKQIEEAKAFRLRNESVYYVGAPLRYNAVIQYLKENIDPDDVISIRSISSSYLPEWRPGQDYRNTYSAHKDQGGGVSTDLIHEWDYLSYLFGLPSKVHCLIGKKSKLEIDSDDYAIYIAEYDNKIAELHLDYFGRKSIREIQLFTAEDTVVGDIVNQHITYLKSGEQIDFHEDRNDYQRRELNYFLDMIFGQSEEDDFFHHGVDILQLTQGRVHR